MKNKYDIIVIGSGPGGEGAAMKSSKEGKKVAVIDDFSEVGGSCTHRGTIPSKALLHSVRQLTVTGKYRDTNFPDLLKHAESVIGNQVKMRRSFYDRNQVDVINGRASFLDENNVEVKLPNGIKEKYFGNAFVIATGARPYHPEDVDFSSSRILDSDTIFNLNENPRSVTIFGAGIIGCEFASIFRGQQIKVNLINNRDQLLSFLDDEISIALSYHLRETGVVIHHNEEYEKVTADANSITVHLKSNKVVSSDLLLWVQGRTGNSNNIGLENIGIKYDERGYISINENYQTSQSHIYAVGDVIGYPSLASAAYDQGRFAATHQIFGKCEHQLVEYIPTGIFTIPEISSVGSTERELTENKIPYEVGHSFFRHLARAQITGHTTGVLKILFHRSTLEILGIHCFGFNAAEIIHIGQTIISQKGKANTLMYFINTTFNYPTMAEAYRVAALNGLNRVK